MGFLCFLQSSDAFLLPFLFFCPLCSLHSVTS
nr:MAG TPA: hypothetical protein [Caudoviricetes sp.]